jgi:hypothetical protein
VPGYLQRFGDLAEGFVYEGELVQRGGVRCIRSQGRLDVSEGFLGRLEAFAVEARQFDEHPLCCAVAGCRRKKLLHRSRRFMPALIRFEVPREVLERFEMAWLHLEHALQRTNRGRDAA